MSQLGQFPLHFLSSLRQSSPCAISDHVPLRPTVRRIRPDGKIVPAFLRFKSSVGCPPLVQQPSARSQLARAPIRQFSSIKFIPEYQSSGSEKESQNRKIDKRKTGRGRNESIQGNHKSIGCETDWETKQKWRGDCSTPPALATWRTTLEWRPESIDSRIPPLKARLDRRVQPGWAVLARERFRKGTRGQCLGRIG